MAMAKTVIYFNGFGLPFSHDYAGGMLVREDIFDNCTVHQGSNCPDDEYQDFIRN